MNLTPNPKKAGYVAVIGRPNVGKSTLMNALLGQKIAAVSPRAQTTRRRQIGILSLDSTQVIFLDTPGMHIPHHKLGIYMNEEAAEALNDADVILWMVEANVAPTEEDSLIANRLKSQSPLQPTYLVLNKSDLASEDQLAGQLVAYQALLPQAKPYTISATNGQGQAELLAAIIADLPAGEPFYEEEQVTDFYERDIAAELIRESALMYLREEVPHCVAVRVDEYKERGDKGAYIAATLFVEKESQKGIVIGQGGEMLKKIGTNARQEIEGMSGRKVYLELRAKVNKNWRDNPEALRHLGYIRDNQK